MILIRVFYVILLFLINISFASQKLEVCYFDTGQGNFIALKTFYDDSSKNKLVMIDCGCTASGKSPTEPYSSEFLVQKNPKREKLLELFKDVSECNILITHDHSDHSNLINLVTEIAKSIGRMESFIKVQPNPKNVPEYSIEQSNYIKDLLGPDTEILHIRPLEWTDNKAKYPEHDYNSIFKLKFAGRTILFPGDVSPQLLNELLSNPLYHNELTDIDFLVASHHGTDAAGEISTFYITTPEMIMICSDPATKHQLPWDIASHLIFKPEKQEDVLVAEHPLSTKTELYQTPKPIFVTSNSGSFYRLEITQNGLAQLFAGKSSIPCFSSKFTEKKLKTRLNSELEQFKQLCSEYLAENPIALSLITPYRLKFLAQNPGLDKSIYFYVSLLKNKLIETKNIFLASEILCTIADISLNKRTDTHRLQLQDLILTDINNIATISPQDSGAILMLLVPILSEKVYEKSITHLYTLWRSNINPETIPDVARLIANLINVNPKNDLVSDFVKFATSNSHISGLLMGTIADITPSDKSQNARSIIEALYTKWASEIDEETIPDVARLIANLINVNPKNDLVSDFVKFATSNSHISGLLMGTIADIIPSDKLPNIRPIIEALYTKWTSEIDEETIPDVARLVIKISSITPNDSLIQHFSTLGF